MKRLTKYLCVLSVLFMLNGCKTDLMTYEGDAGVYFAVQYPWTLSSYGDSLRWELCPETEVSFFLKEVQDSVISIRVQITGDAADYDRYFRVVVVDTGTTAVVGHDFEAIAETQKVAAGSHYTDVKIRLYKQADLSGLRRSLMLRLEETADFRLPMGTWYPWPGQYKWAPATGVATVDISAIEHTIYISDIISVPEGWSACLGLLGTFTEKKFYLMCEIYNLTIDDFSKESMNTSRGRALGERFDAWLKAQKEAGNEILEEDGTPMEMGFALNL